MYIQYVGFDLSDGSRTYGFHVIDAPDHTREFDVRVQSDSFRTGSLRLQDGPGICFSRLKRELQEELVGTRVEAHLNIRPEDILEYLEKQGPSKSRVKKRRPVEDVPLTQASSFEPLRDLGRNRL
jgi:hypothetical protein